MRLFIFHYERDVQYFEPSPFDYGCGNTESKVKDSAAVYAVNLEAAKKKFEILYSTRPLSVTEFR